MNKRSFRIQHAQLRLSLLDCLDTPPANMKCAAAAAVLLASGVAAFTSPAFMGAQVAARTASSKGEQNLCLIFCPAVLVQARASEGQALKLHAWSTAGGGACVVLCAVQSCVFQRPKAHVCRERQLKRRRLKAGALNAQLRTTAVRLEPLGAAGCVCGERGRARAHA
jgi:hypothetical protein